MTARRMPARLTTGRQTQAACFRVALTNGEVIRISQIERDTGTGRMFVRDTLGRIYRADQILTIITDDA